MNREQAKLELDATTLRPQDASPEARAMLESDAELAAWHTRRSAFDERIAEVLAASVPASLKEDILSAAKKPARKPLRWITPAFLTAAAACIALAGLVFWPEGSAMAPWESESLAVVEKIEYGMLPLDAPASDYEEAKALLVEWDRPSPSFLPAMIASLPTYGCKRVQIAGRQASVICFEIPSGKEAHLIVFDNAGLKGRPAQDSPRVKSSNNWHYASWSHGSQSFMLATTGDEAELKQLLGLA